jgi:hypothetical protein
MGAVAPEGCWISQWRAEWMEGNLPYIIEGVLNDGCVLPPLCWIDGNGCWAEDIVGEAGGSVTAVHGR